MTVRVLRDPVALVSTDARRVRDSGVAREPRDWDCDADEGADGFSREALINL